MIQTDQKIDEEYLENELIYYKKQFTVDKGQGLMRIDKWLQQKLENISRHKIQQEIDAQNVTVNGKITQNNYKIKPLDIIEIVSSNSPEKSKIIPQELPLDIVYEDEHLIIINKGANMVVHPAIGNYSGTLLNAVCGHYQKNNYQPDPELYRLGLVHRIDKNTTGLIVLAKTVTAAVHLAKQFFNHTIERQYFAVVWGDLTQLQGTIKTNIGRHPRFRKQFTSFPYESEMGKSAITHYFVQKQLYYISTVICQLETGRTHQIRVHLKHLGHTIFNDFEYGGDKILKGTIYQKYKQFVTHCFSICPRPALHAQTLGFIHPASQKKMQFTTNLPTDMKLLIEKWENYIQNKIS